MCLSFSNSCSFHREKIISTNTTNKGYAFGLVHRYQLGCSDTIPEFLGSASCVQNTVNTDPQGQLAMAHLVFHVIQWLLLMCDTCVGVPALCFSLIWLQPRRRLDRQPVDEGCCLLCVPDFTVSIKNS